jgi:hypothetical protein
MAANHTKRVVNNRILRKRCEIGFQVPLIDSHVEAIDEVDDVTAVPGING